MIYKPPYLEPYKGRASRHECPACGDRQSFVRYLDGNTDAMIHPSVGRCNHEDKCGYHYTPRQYFADNPERKTKYTPAVSSRPPHHLIQQKEPPREPGSIPQEFLVSSSSDDSNFVKFLRTLFDRSTIERLMTDYRLGATGNGSVIFWQIDGQERIRTGKIMQYNPATGKRIKNSPRAIDWVHACLKRDGTLPGEFNLVQCLFGEHLLKRHPDKVVALVESEKSALIGAGVYPDHVWLASGGRSQISNDKLRVLKGRTVIMFPDVDGYDLWCKNAPVIEAMGCRVMVSDLLERKATPADREAQIDLADWLIRQLKVCKYSI